MAVVAAANEFLQMARYGVRDENLINCYSKDIAITKQPTIVLDVESSRLTSQCLLTRQPCYVVALAAYKWVQDLHTSVEGALFRLCLLPA